MQYGGAFFAEFRLIGADQGQREAQTAEAGQVRLAFAAGLAEAFLCFPERGHGVPAFQEGDDALKQGAPEFRPVEQRPASASNRISAGQGGRSASEERSCGKTSRQLRRFLVMLPASTSGMRLLVITSSLMRGGSAASQPGSVGVSANCFRA